MQLRTLALLSLFVIAWPPPLLTQTTVTYEQDLADFPNPERGFYRYSETRESNYTPLNQTVLENNRQLQMPFGANYSVHSSLVFRYFLLDNSISSSIHQATLDSIAADFAIARAAGVKVIPRFAYTLTETPGSCAVANTCPPYGDATKEKVLQHIQALAAVLQANEDVIATVQLGFIGIYGEN